jgi:hypothetical protein
MSTRIEIETYPSNLWVLGRDFACRRSNYLPPLRVENGPVWLDAKAVEPSGKVIPIRLEGEMRQGGFHTSGQMYVVGEAA